MKQDDLPWARAEAGMAQAAEKAERVEPGWKGAALEAVRAHARTHLDFLTEDVRACFATPESADTRAWGAVMQAAKKAGIVEPNGYALADCSNRSPRVLWRSLVCELNVIRRPDSFPQ